MKNIHKVVDKGFLLCIIKLISVLFRKLNISLSRETEGLAQ